MGSNHSDVLMYLRGNSTGTDDDRPYLHKGFCQAEIIFVPAGKAGENLSFRARITRSYPTDETFVELVKK